MGEQVRYFGYDEHLVQKIRAAVQVFPDGETPGVAILRDVMALPGRDALYDTEGGRIDLTLRSYIPPEIRPPHALDWLKAKEDRFSPVKIDAPRPEAVVEQAVFYGGVVWPNFGHFLTDAMSRFWSLDEPGEYWPVLYLNRMTPDFLNVPHIGATLRSLGLGSARPILTIDRPTLFKRVLAPLPSIQGPYRIYHCHQRAHLHVAQQILGDPKVSDYRRPVYLSRSGLPVGERRSRDEAVLEEKLRLEGFLIVRPELLPLADQIDIFNSSPQIVGAIGSAFHTSLFSRPGFRGELFMLTWGKPNGRFTMIDAIKYNSSNYLNCMEVVSLRPDKRIDDIRIRVDEAMDMLASAGALAPRR